MKNLVLILMILCSGISFGQNDKVVGGYFPYWRDVNNVDFTSYNYLYYAFVFPNLDGTLNYNASVFNDFKSSTSNLSAKRLISVGSTGMPDMAKDIVARKKFVGNLVTMCLNNGLDGIDMDWEAINNVEDRDNFTLLMKELRIEIDNTNMSSNLTLELVATIGFGNYWLQWYENEALDQADFLQIMVYDQTGTWASSPYGNHASMDHYRQAETYWVGRGYSRDKLVMGLPFYGYKFKDSNGGLAEAVTYQEIVNQFPNIKSSDNELNNQTGYYYFNGSDLIKEKTAYAFDNGFKGVFVWEIAQDDLSDSLSLQKSMDKEVDSRKILDLKNTLSKNSVSIYPNPVQNKLTVVVPSYEEEVVVKVFTMDKKLIEETVINNEREISIDMTKYDTGVYLLSILLDGELLQTKKIIK